MSFGKDHGMSLLTFGIILFLSLPIEARVSGPRFSAILLVGR